MSIYQSIKPAPYVYMCVHKTTGHFYIGYREKNVNLNRTSNIDLPLYRTSSKYINPTFEEYDWQIVAEFIDGISAYEFEQVLIQEHWNNPLLINRQYHTKKDTQFRNNGHSEETKQKMRKPKPPRSPEHCLNMSKSKQGKKRAPRTEEHCRNISVAKTGTKRPPVSEETKKKLSLALTGKKFGSPSEETRRKMSESAKQRHQKIIIKESDPNITQ